MTARIAERRVLDWQIELGSTTVTRSLSAVAKMIPDGLWQHRSVRTVMGAVAGPLLGASRLSLDGIAPNGQWFEAHPKLIWFVTGPCALLHEADLGPSGPLARQGSLGRFLIPSKGSSPSVSPSSSRSRKAATWR